MSKTDMAQGGSSEKVDPGGYPSASSFPHPAADDAKNSSSTADDGGPSRFFLEALQKAARQRRSAASSSSATPCAASGGPAAPACSDECSSSLPGCPSTATVAQATVARPKPAPPQGPPPSARPRSAMAAIAGAARARAKTEAAETESSKSVGSGGNSGGSHILAKADCPSVTNIKAVGHIDASGGRPISSSKHGSREFVDPRLERLQFLQAVQRLRAQISTQEVVPGDALAQKINADLIAKRPGNAQRPQSATARLQDTAQEPSCRSVPKAQLSLH